MVVTTNLLLVSKAFEFVIVKVDNCEYVQY